MNDKNRELYQNLNKRPKSIPKKSLLKKPRRSNKLKTEVNRREAKISEGKNRSFVNRGKMFVRKKKKPSPRKGKNSFHEVFKHGSNSVGFAEDQANNKPKFVHFGLAALVSLILMFFGSVDAVLSEGLFFVFVGVMVLRMPVFYSSSPLIDRFVLAVLGLSLVSFFPSFNFLYPAWRTTAVEIHSLNLGGMHSIVPLHSFEGLLVMAAIITLFYNMGAWKLNSSGRNRLQYVFVFLLIIVGLISYRYGAEPLKIFFSTVSHFSPNKDYIENIAWFSVLIGLSSALLVIQRWKQKSRGLVVGFTGLIISSILLIKLTYSVYSLSLIGATFAFIFYHILREQSRADLKIALSVIFGTLILVVFMNQAYCFELFNKVNAHVYNEIQAIWFSIRAVFENVSLFGNGIGTSNYLLSLINPFHLFSESGSYHGINLKRFILDFGILGMVFLYVFCYRGIKSNLRKNKIKRVGFKLLGHVFLSLLALRFIFSDSQSSIGLVLFFLVIFYLCYSVSSRKRPLLSPVIARSVGYIWIGVGLIWLYASTLNQPLHSEVRNRLVFSSHTSVMGLLNLNRVSPKADLNLHLISDMHPAKSYIQAQKHLSDGGDFLELQRELSSFQFLNLNHDRLNLYLIYLAIDNNMDAAVGLSNAYFKEDPMGKIAEYRSLVASLKDEPEKLMQFEDLSCLHPEYRLHYLMLLKGFYLKQSLLNKPFDQLDTIEASDKFNYIQHLIQNGFFEQSEVLLAHNKDSVTNAWYLAALKEKEFGDFETALSVIRSEIETSEITYSQMQSSRNFHTRVFLNNTPNENVGGYLLNKEILLFNYPEALKIVQHILKMEKPPLFAYYWEAELLYRLEDFEESWFSFERYFQKLKIRSLQ